MGARPPPGRFFLRRKSWTRPIPAGTTLRDVEVAVDDGAVYLTDDGYSFRHEGGTDGDGPGSTSHLSL